MINTKESDKMEYDEVIKLLKNHPLTWVEDEEWNWFGINGHYIVINGQKFDQFFGMELASVVVDFSYQTLDIRCDNAIVNGIEIGGIFKIYLHDIDTLDIIKD